MSDTTPSGDSTAPAPKKRARPRNVIFDALVEVCGLDASQMTRSELAHIGKCSAELKEVAATPVMIAARADVYARIFPNAEMTPAALVKHWSRLGQGTRDPASTPEPYSHH